MSKIANGATRLKNARETYVEQLAHGRGMNRKREIFTGINPTDDADFAYRSTPSYLRQLAQQGSIPSNEMLVAANVPRTKSASELTPRNNLTRSINGNPKYKAQEDYYEEIQSMKKDMKGIRDENSNLRAKIRRLEEDNTRKRKEIDTLYDSNKDGDLRRTLTGSTTDRNNPLANTNNATNVVMSLKQRLFKLESQLKQKETVMDELRSDPRWTKGTELELQNRALLGEIERQKMERLNFIQKNDYTAVLDEEKKDAIRKLTKEKDELKEENTSLKKKIREMGKTGVMEPLSARSTTEKPLVEESEEFKSMKHELDQANQELKQTQTKLGQVQQKLEQANEDLLRGKHEKSEQVNAEVEKIKRDRHALEEKSNRISDELEEVKRDRDQCKKRLDQTDVELEKTKNDRDQYKKQLEAANDQLKRLPSNERIPSPRPVPSRRPLSPPEDSGMAPQRATASRDTSLSDEPNSKTNKNDSPLSSRNVAQESALKTVQASLRGHLARNETSKTQDRPGPASPKQARSPSLLIPVPAGTGSTTALPNLKTKSPSASQTTIRDPDPSSKVHSSSPTDQNPSMPNPIPAGTGTIAHAPTRKDKSTPSSRASILDLDSSSKAHSSSPTTKKPSTPTASSNALPHSLPSDNPAPVPRKSPAGSKQSVKAPASDDDDDIIIT